MDQYIFPLVWVFEVWKNYPCSGLCSRKWLNWIWSVMFWLTLNYVFGTCSMFYENITTINRKLHKTHFFMTKMLFFDCQVQSGRWGAKGTARGKVDGLAELNVLFKWINQDRVFSRSSTLRTVFLGPSGFSLKLLGASTYGTSHFWNLPL